MIYLDFKLVLDVIQAIGAIATAISVIILLSKFSTRLKVRGELSRNNWSEYIISIFNNTSFDNEIKSILFWKGNPKGLLSSPSVFYAVDMSSIEKPRNEITGNIILGRDSYIDIPIPKKDIVSHYNEIGEAIGKPYDTIFVQVIDRKGHSYCINTHANIDMFRIDNK